MRFFVKLSLSLIALAMLGTVLVAGGTLYILYRYGQDLPDFKRLAAYQPPVATRIYAGDGRLMSEFARQQRVFVEIESIPRLVVGAFVSAEDKTFFDHPGLDFPGIVRAVIVNVQAMGTGRRPVGASTITQQVAKNFLLTNEVSIERKLKEAILAIRIEQAFSKEEILELYLNEIYLGLGSYGVAAAALNYFNKALNELTLAEAAYLAGLPKAPNNYHPIRRPEAAVARRGYVLRRMLEDGLITQADFDVARDEPLAMHPGADIDFVEARYFTEEVRRTLFGQFGENALYDGGLTVRTTLDPALQEIASRVLRDGLVAYDRRHGYRGPITRLSSFDDWIGQLNALEPHNGRPFWEYAVVLEADAAEARLGLISGKRGRIVLDQMTWAREALPDGGRGPAITAVTDVLRPGDVILVTPAEALADENGKLVEPDPDMYWLRQIPKVQGALVALDPHTGRVLAMEGGFNYELSEFNRAVQATRQPGSAFKPFVYLAALERGYTPASIVLDAPIVLEQGPGQAAWKPENYSREFYGPTTLRVGLERSRNVMTVRVAEDIGIDAIVEVADRFDIDDDLAPNLSASLGAAEVNLLNLTAAYGMFVNGGKRVVPALIDRVQDRHGKTIWRHDGRQCMGCSGAFWEASLRVPPLPDIREQVTDPRYAYQIVHMLEGVVQRGTGRRIAELGRPLAGKTGTTNEQRDTWFIGFSPDLAVGVFVGFDEPRGLGRGETGSSVAAPIFKDFMEEALADEPVLPFRVPEGIRLVQVDPSNGRRAIGPGTIWEAFIPGTEPTGAPRILGGSTPEVSQTPGSVTAAPARSILGTGTGGLY